ncbi:MAG TPA: glycosyl hydrolase [Terriglobales bacterium]|nr:glycosyl hydrolase [Terriglobales bacterium]
MQRNFLILAILLLATFAAAQQTPATPVRFDSGAISGLPIRNIGSAAMSGRIAAVTARNEDGRLTIFVGSASGGVWKSINGGTTFKPVFDNQDVQSIGAVTIDPSNPKTVWVGTGESWARNSVSIGDGVYKSTDGGENWTNVGLKNSEHIAKILVDPKNGNNVLVCAMGPIWSDGDERGVYKTSDGGKTWHKVLAGANPATGCSMLSMAASEPNTVYATMWDFRRQAWTFRSGGPGSGIFKSTDGGEHWTEINQQNAKGLPNKPYGRIAIAVAPSKPQTVYAMIESEKSALYRSDDGGQSWTRGDASQFMIWRPFYFANLIVDPKNPEKLFKVDGPLLVSVNGGRSFNSTANSGHGDHHDMWIDPDNPNTVFTGDDGGFWRSLDGGTRWEHMMNLPVSQFYHVSVDNDIPYHVYGGLQDNSSWVGDSAYPGGIGNPQWENMYGGDGFWMWEDPSDPNYLYAEAQGGEIGRVNRHTHELRPIKPYAQYGEKKLRFNWNTPIQMSPNEKGTIYLGSQFLYRSRDHGQSWERISPDLSTNDPEKQKQEESGGVTIDNSAAEMNTTIYSISESPKNGQLMWAGTDDGNLQITRDGGKNWTNVASNLPGVAQPSWISWVEASRYEEGTAYTTVDRHSSGDMKPYLFKTADYGKTWTALPLESVRGYAHVIKEDTVNPNLLFLGTEFGLWVSIDGGQRWMQFKGSNFPDVAVRDVVVHPRDSDLILATHGRGIWIVDDITPLRNLTPQLMAEEAGFLPMPPAVQRMETFGGWPYGDAAFVGETRSTAAFIPYYQKTRHIFGDLKIEVFDDQGKLIDTVPSSKHRGVNRAVWNMHVRPPKTPPAASAMFQTAVGPRVVPGTYTVKMTKGDKTYTSKLNVVLDPRAKFTVEDRRTNFDLAMKIGNTLNHMSWAVDAIVGLRNTANQYSSQLKANDPLRAKLADLASKADAIRGKIVATKEGGAITGEERLREYTGTLYGDVTNYEGRPTNEEVARADVLSRELEDVIKEFQGLTAQNLPVINKQLSSKKLKPISVVTEAEWQAAQQQEEGGNAGKSEGRFERD